MGDVSVSREIKAPPEAIYAMVADLPRMGEWSPECERVEWTKGATGPAVGATFDGHNRNGSKSWSTHGEVVVADPGKEFAFEVRTVLNLPVSRWSYRFEPSDAGTTVTESTIDRRSWLVRNLGSMATGVSDRTARNRETMEKTLEELAAAAEAGASKQSPDEVERVGGGAVGRGPSARRRKASPPEGNAEP
jgi:uncharacterized protein YndB with AHSA1/START domain